MGATNNSDRFLILAPTGRDARLAVAALTDAGLHAAAVRDIEDLCRTLRLGAAATIITEEALDLAAMKCLREELERQPAWSDLPLIIFTSQPSAEMTVRSFEQLGHRANVTLVERPIRVKTMISAARAALRARQRQYEVRDLLTALEQRLEERDQFLAMLSHELRNPLAAISLAIHELEQNTTPSHERAVIVRQTRHLKQLVDDLLDIARVTSGKIALHKTSLDLSDIVEHCLETMRPRAEARRLRMSLQQQVEHATVNGDPVRLEQVVNNLLSNAIKYTPPGGEITIFVEREGEEAVLRVRDTGKGIAPEMLTRIFDMFMQGETTIDRTEGGMGIGLTLVKRLVEQHSGSIRAYSAGRGSGSEFVVRLPLTKVKVTPAPKPRPSPAPKNDVRRRIVVVEDNADIRDLLRIKLRQLGHEVDTADDGVKGLETILTSRPEVALVDIGLPALDGYEVARRVRAEIGDQIYLIALTGYGQSEDKKRAMEAGFDVHLTKPADFIDLQNVLAHASRRPGTVTETSGAA